jgi:hypothetical protein
MLASTIQFSKYGQEHQPYITTTLGKHLAGETTHPLKHTHQEFGESRPQPHTYTSHTIRKEHVSQCRK